LVDIRAFGVDLTSTDRRCAEWLARRATAGFEPVLPVVSTIIETLRRPQEVAGVRGA
jgi:hypothetical protein